MTRPMPAQPLLLSEDQLSRYWADGFVAVERVFPEREILAWQAECDRLWSMATADGKDPRIQWRGHAATGTVADRIDPVIDISPVFHRLAHDERLLNAARSVLVGEPTLFKDKLITKRPGTMGYGMHQDFPYWVSMGFPADAAVTVQASIDPADEANGAIQMFPGLHRAPLDPPPDEPNDVDESKMDLTRGQIIASQAGDMLLFHGLVPHRSGPNTSTRSRRAFFATYTTIEYIGIYERYQRERNRTSPTSGSSKNPPPR